MAQKKKRSGSSTKRSNGSRFDKQAIDLLQQRTAFLHRLLGFKHFLSSGFEPEISDAEIVVCFADVRGFTAYCRKLQQEMQDRKIQNFLRNYFKIFNEGLMELLAGYSEEASREDLDMISKIEKHLVPTMYKNLGDGLMMVWEIPFDLDIQLQGNLTQHIIYLVNEIQSRFYYRFRNLNPVEIDAYSQEVTELEIGFGIAKGHAWRLDFGQSVDYAGSIINLASRLASVARPCGIVAHYDVSTWLLGEMVKNKDGKIVSLDNIKGYEPGIKVWCDSSVNVTEDTLATEGLELSKSKDEKVKSSKTKRKTKS